MTAQPSSSDHKVTHRHHLIEHFEAGCKPAGRWRIGTEHEKFVFHADTLRPAAYNGPNGIRTRKRQPRAALR